MDYIKKDKEVEQLKNNYRNKSEKIRLIEYERLVIDPKKIDSLINENITFNNCKWDDKPIKFKYKEYSFCNFKDSKFGEKTVLREKDMYNAQVDFWNVTFTNCIFENIHFKSSVFWGCRFIDCKFRGMGTIFDDCSFRNICIDTDEKGDIIETNASTEFVSCNIAGTRIRNSITSYMIFEKNDFILSSFMDCEMEECIFDGNSFRGTIVNNCNIFNLNVINIKHADIEFHFTNLEKDTNLHKNIYVSKINEEYKIEGKNDYVILAKMYYTLIDYLQKKNLDTDNMSEYRFLYSYYSMLSKQRLNQVWDRISWLICGFGEKIERLFGWFVFLILIPAIGYMISGIKVGESVINYDIIGCTPVGLDKWFEDFGLCLHFSIVTFSTVGYGNIIPDGLGSYIISASQILIGILFIATLTSVTIKKILK